MQNFSFPQAVFARPKMYTLGGSFDEVVAFLEGYYSAAAKCPGYNPAFHIWMPFKSWLAARLGVHENEVFVKFKQNALSASPLTATVIDANMKDAIEFFKENDLSTSSLSYTVLGLLAEYQESHPLTEE